MSAFAEGSGGPPAVVAEAHGRVNLIGEHTDYNGGFVLPTLIAQRTRVELSPRSDRRVRVFSATMGGGTREFELGKECRVCDWLDYVQGTTCIATAAGFPLTGFDLAIGSDVPVGSGLSSSAALDVGLLRALRQAFALQVDDLEIARLGRRIENEFVGAQVGIMDPMACSLGECGSALFIDARSLAYERVPLPQTAELVVIHSGLAHQHAGGDYNTRRAECEQACRLLGVTQLRELSLDDLPRLEALPAPLDRRVRHVVTENERVLEAVAALRSGNVARLGELFIGSHRSQRDDYAVSIPEIDLLVDLANADPAVYGARLTGGGFGGSIVVLAHAGAGHAVGQRVVEEYRRCTGQPARSLGVVQPLPMARGAD